MILPRLDPGRERPYNSLCVELSKGSAMRTTSEQKGKKKGFFAMLKESIIKSNEGCGPGCGCHAASDKKTAKGREASKPTKKA